MARILRTERAVEGRWKGLRAHLPVHELRRLGVLRVLGAPAPALEADGLTYRSGRVRDIFRVISIIISGRGIARRYLDAIGWKE